jgi:hypothetical protein
MQKTANHGFFAFGFCFSLLTIAGFLAIFANIYLTNLTDPDQKNSTFDRFKSGIADCNRVSADLREQGIPEPNDETLMFTVDGVLERAKLYAAKALDGNEIFDRLAKKHNNGIPHSRFWIESIFDCSEYAKVAILVLKHTLADKRIETLYVSSGNGGGLLDDSHLGNIVQGPYAHAMIVIKISNYWYKIYDPQSGDHSGWRRLQGDGAALEEASKLFVGRYSQTTSEDISAGLAGLIAFKIVPERRYSAIPINQEAYTLFLEAVSAAGGETSLLPPAKLIAFKNRMAVELYDRL